MKTKGQQTKPEQNLGPLVATYPYRPLRKRDLLTHVLPGILAVSVPLGYGIARARYAYNHFGPVAAAFWSRPWYLLSLLALFVFISLILYRLMLARRFVSIHKNGLHMKYPREKSLPWRQIAGVTTGITQDHFLGIPLRTHYQAVLYPNIGKPIKLTNALQDLPECITHIKASLYPRLLPDLESNFQAGQWLHFGPLFLHKSSLRLKDRKIPWTQVQHVTVESGDLMVELQDRTRIRQSISQIPNLELILQLIQRGVDA
jgi:hypothetical protein